MLCHYDSFSLEEGTLAPGSPSAKVSDPLVTPAV